MKESNSLTQILSLHNVFIFRVWCLPYKWSWLVLNDIIGFSPQMMTQMQKTLSWLRWHTSLISHLLICMTRLGAPFFALGLREWMTSVIHSRIEIKLSWSSCVPWLDLVYWVYNSTWTLFGIVSVDLEMLVSRPYKKQVCLFTV